MPHPHPILCLAQHLTPSPSLCLCLAQTFDFSVLSLLLAAVATTIKFPHKLAFIIIHTDQYGVSAEQASPQLVMGGL